MARAILSLNNSQLNNGTVPYLNRSADLAGSDVYDEHFSVVGGADDQIIPSH
jgi:hypothetical protein